MSTWWVLFPYHCPQKKEKEKEEVIYRFYTLLLVNIYFLNLKNFLPNNYFLFLVFWKLFLKVGAKYI